MEEWGRGRGISEVTSRRAQHMRHRSVVCLCFIHIHGDGEGEQQRTSGSSGGTARSFRCMSSSVLPRFTVYSLTLTHLSVSIKGASGGLFFTVASSRVTIETGCTGRMVDVSFSIFM